MPVLLHRESKVDLPSGSTGLCLTLVFDWLSLVVAEFATPSGFTVTAAGGDARMAALAARSDVAARHVENRRALSKCSHDDIVSAATVLTTYFVSQTTNQGQGRFYPRHVRWKEWLKTDAAAPQKVINSSDESWSLSLMFTRSGMATSKTNTFATTRTRMHAMGVLYFKDKNAIVFYEPQTGEFVLQGDAVNFWDVLWKERGSVPISHYGLFKFSPSWVLHGTLGELLALGQITPPVPVPAL